MTYYETVKHHFAALKTSSPENISRHSLAILENYIFLDKKLQQEFIEEIHKWQDQKKKLHPLLSCYLRYIYAFSLFYSEQYDNALPLIVELQDSFTNLNDPNGAASCMVIQGSIYRTFGDIDLALKSLWAGYQQLKTAPEYQLFLLAAGVTIGGTYFELKQYDEALPVFSSTLEQAEKGNKFYWIIYSLHGLGKVYIMKHQFEEAKNCLEKAMTVADKNNHPLSVCNSLSELGNYYYATGEFEQAEKYHKQSLELKERHHYIGGAVTSCIRLGEIYIQQNHLDEAITILEKGLTLAEQIKVKPKIYQIHKLLSDIYKSKSELKSCLSHYQQFHELQEQVKVEDNTRKIKNALLIFEAEQTKKENIIIKKQKEEIERKNIELQETIDELTLSRVSNKAKAITLIIAIIMFVFEDTILHFVLNVVHSENYFISMIVKMVIIFSLSPINKAIEHHLLKRIVKKRRREILV